MPVSINTPEDSGETEESYTFIRNRVSAAFPNAPKMPETVEELGRYVLESIVIWHTMDKFVGPVIDGINERVELQVKTPPGLDALPRDYIVAGIALTFVKSYVDPDENNPTPDHDHDVIRELRSLSLSITDQMLSQLKTKAPDENSTSTTRPSRRAHKPPEGWQMDDLSDLD